MNKEMMDFFKKLNKEIIHSDKNSSERFIKYLELYGFNYSYMPINWQIEEFDIVGYKVVSTEDEFYVDLLLVEFDETWATTKNVHIDFFEDELFSLCSYDQKERRKIYGHSVKYNLARAISKTKNSIHITLITNQHTEIGFEHVKTIDIDEIYKMYLEKQHEKFGKVLPATSKAQEKIVQKYKDVEEYYYALTNTINSKKGDEHSNLIRFIKRYDLNYEFEPLNLFFKGYSIKGYNKVESSSKNGYSIELIVAEFIQERISSETFHIEEFQEEVWKLYDLNANECAIKYGALSDEYKLSRLLHETDSSICIKLITNQATKIDLAHVKKVDINDLYNLYIKLHKNGGSVASMEFEVPYKVDITYAQKGISKYYIELLDEIYDKNSNKYDNLINYLQSYGNEYNYEPLKLFRSGFCIKGYRVKKNTNKIGYCTELLIVEVSKEQVVTRNQHIEALQKKIWELYGLEPEEYAEKYGINSCEYKLACALYKSNSSIRITFVTNQIANISTVGVKTLDICGIQKLIDNIDRSSEISIPRCEVIIPNEHVKIYVFRLTIEQIIKMDIEKAYDKKVSKVYHSFESTIINTPHLITSLAPVINGTASSIDEFDPITGNIRLKNLRITQNAKVIDLCIKNSTNILKEQLVFKLTLLNDKELSPKVEVIEKEVQPEIGNYDKQMTNEMNILFLSEIEKYLANGQIKIDELLKYRTTKLPDIFYRNHVDEISNDYWISFGKSKIFTIEFDDQQWCKLLERNIISIEDFEKYKKWDLLEKFGSEEQKKKALNKKSLLCMDGDGDDIWVYAKKW